ncbi:hypothetical protein MA16_Dca025194 [Dendrobium catenatum]|uniref:Uncharacterized protein n=1 Tax=Dendrobium catenatum TaxID=906689 RepID=A0A2I0XEP0_9ASPA|nr:hypothetical protein MA16_Dca025194 [Dendrobium catenatum]
MADFPQNCSVSPVTEAVSVGKVNGSSDGLGSGEVQWGDAGAMEASGDLDKIA